MNQVNQFEILERLKEVKEQVEGTLNQENNFTVKTESCEGISYTHDRENYLSVGLDIALEQIYLLIDEIEERTIQNRKLKLIKGKRVK